MTLLVTILKADETIQLADRKLSESTGIFSGTSNKISYVMANDGQMLLAFTGLAACGLFQTSEWLLDALFRSKGNGNIENAYFGLADLASKEFFDNSLIKQLPPADKRLTIVGSGHGHDGTPLFFRASNFISTDGMVSPEASDKFELLALTGKLDEFRSMIYWDGYIVYASTDDFEPVNALVEGNCPTAAIIGKAVAVMREISSKRNTSNFVGTDISVARLPATIGASPVSSYYPDGVDSELPLSANLVDIRTGAPGLMIRDIKIEGVEAVSSSTPRNARCPCGSGKKFKNCHGRK